MLDTRENLNLNNKEDRYLSNKLLIKHLFNLIEDIKPQFSIEIGAFSADFSKEVKKRYPNINVYAFEANPHNFNHFNQKFEYEKMGINYLNMAVSNTEGEVEFHIQKEINDKEISPIRGNNSIMNRIQDNTKYDIIKVKSITMDKFILDKNINLKNSILWIDVEGANEKVLKGCERILDNVSIIFIEVEEKEFWKNQWLENDVREFLTKNNFKLIARDGEYPSQYNQIYIRE